MMVSVLADSMETEWVVLRDLMKAVKLAQQKAVTLVVPMVDQKAGTKDCMKAQSTVVQKVPWSAVLMAANLDGQMVAM